MPYTLDRFDGTTLVTLADGVVDNTTDLQLVGRNVAGYGEIQNENFIKLLENFARADTPPSKPLVGQLWFDKNQDKFRPAVFDGTQWRTLGVVQVTSVEPNNRKEGDLWWDSTNNQLYGWTADGDQHVLIGPESLTGFDVTRWVTMKLTDTSAVDHPVVVGYVDGDPFVLMADTAFTNDQNVTPLVGFDTIKTGMNLVNTNNDGVTTGNSRYTGTATDATRLKGRDGDTYANRLDDEVITGKYSFATDLGLTVGDSAEMSLKVYNGNEPVIINETGTTLGLGVNYPGSSTDKRVIVISNKQILPYIDNTMDLGSPSLKFRNIYGDAIYANIVGDITGQSAGTHTGNTFGTHTGAVTTPTVSNTGGTPIIDADATVQYPDIVASAGVVNGKFLGAAAYTINGMVLNEDQVVTANHDFTGNIEVTAAGSLTLNGTTTANGTINADRIQTTNSYIAKGVIGRGAKFNGLTDLNTGVTDLTIDRVTIKESTIKQNSRFEGGTIDGTAIEGATIGGAAPAVNIISTLYTDTVGKSFSRISDDGTFNNANNNTVVTALAIKQYVDTKVEGVTNDVVFHMDTKDMTQADVLSQLNRIAPAINYPEGTYARILGSYYFNDVPRDYYGNKKYVVFYGSGRRLTGIGYIGGRATSDNTTRTDVLTAKSAITGYLYQRQAGSQAVVSTQSVTLNANLGNLATLINSRTFSGWLEFNNKLTAAEANAIGNPAIENAYVLAIKDGVVLDYSSTAGQQLLYDGQQNFRRTGAEQFDGAVTLGNVGNIVEGYNFDYTSVQDNAIWVYKGSF